MSAVYLPIFVMLLFSGALAGGMLLFSMPFGPYNPTQVKSEPFECGCKPIGPNRVRFSAQFYILAILLVVFDIEAAFMFPWAVLFSKLGVAGFIEMLVFIGVLVLGFVYLWRSGGLDALDK
jgi:NADH-quinone oxidoreductase subunit A